MRFLVDAQLPEKLCDWLRERGFEAGYVGTALAGETPDRDIAAFAADNGYVLMSKDEDFVVRYPPVAYQLVWLRVGNATNRVLITWIEARFANIVVALENGERLVEVR